MVAGRSRARGIAVAAAGMILPALLGVLALANAGDASGKAKHAGLVARHKSVPVSATQGTIDTAQATCPKRSVAISGGFTAKPNGPFGGLLPFESRRIGKRAWRVTGVVATSGGSSSTLSSYVYCKRGKLPRQASATTTVVGGNEQTVSAHCKGSSKPVSGGFFSQVNSDFTQSALPRASKRAGAHAWSLRSHGTDGTATLTAYAYCRKGPGTKVRSGKSGEITPAGSAAKSRACPAGTTILAGGFSIKAVGQDYGLLDFRRQGKRWLTKVHSFDSGGGKATSYGYCG